MPSSRRMCRPGAPDTVGWASSSTVQLVRGGMTVRHSSEPEVTSGSPVAVTRMPRLPSARVSTSSAPRTSACARAGGVRPSLTANRSAKSASTCTATFSAVASRPRLVSVIDSCSPSPTSRSRTTSRVLSASPACGGRRSTNRAANASGAVTDSGCGDSPSSRSSQRDSTRASRKNSPCGVPGATSPVAPDRQNVVPSTTVIGPAPPSAGTRGGPAPSTGAGLPIFASTTGQTFHHRPAAHYGLIAIMSPPVSHRPPQVAFCPAVTRQSSDLRRPTAGCRRPVRRSGRPARVPG